MLDDMEEQYTLLASEVRMHVRKDLHLRKRDRLLRPECYQYWKITRGYRAHIYSTITVIGLLYQVNQSIRKKLIRESMRQIIEP